MNVSITYNCKKEAEGSKKMVTKEEIYKLAGTGNEKMVEFAFGFNDNGHAINLAESLFGREVELTSEEVDKMLSNLILKK